MSDPFNKKQSVSFECIGHGYYIAQNHQGFKQALSHWRGDQVLRDMEIRGTPTKFPSMVHLSFGYAGYSFVSASCVPLGTIKAAIEKAEPKLCV